MVLHFDAADLLKSSERHYAALRSTLRITVHPSQGRLRSYGDLGSVW